MFTLQSLLSLFLMLYKHNSTSMLRYMSPISEGLEDKTLRLLINRIVLDLPYLETCILLSLFEHFKM